VFINRGWQGRRVQAGWRPPKPRTQPSAYLGAHPSAVGLGFRQAGLPLSIDG